jgi:hypothetical protein
MVFSLVRRLPSALSACVYILLFERFIGTMQQSDSSPAFMSVFGFRLPRSGLLSFAGTSEVSRFSCMLFLRVRGIFDYAGFHRNSRYRFDGYCLPLLSTGSTSQLAFSQLYNPAHECLCLRFDSHLTMNAARLEVRMVRYSFPAGLFHSQQHAGLSRRTDSEQFRRTFTSGPLEAHWGRATEV